MEVPGVFGSDNDALEYCGCLGSVVEMKVVILGNVEKGPKAVMEEFDLGEVVDALGGDFSGDDSQA